MKRRRPSRRERRLANPEILKRSHVAEEALPLIDHNEVAYIHAAKMQLQPQLNNAYEGIPIFIVPQNGLGPSTVSLAALQRAAAPTTQVLPDLSPLLTPSFLPNTIAMPNMFYNPFYPQVYNPSLIPQWQA
ncbi:hypothetical protein Q1695_001480 [Nippostrongylus brasiliensis]|nr:hypothetical protein Q1695_001480 [Nippostrongylus brasiliensis]